MYQNRRHRTSRKSSHRKERGIERFFTSRLFIVLGILFLLIGLYYAFSSSGGSGNFYDMFINALQPTNGGSRPAIEFSGKGTWVLLLCFVPAILALSISGFYARKYKSITYNATLIIILFLIAMQVKVLMLFITGETHSFFIAVALSLLLPILLLFVSAYYHRKPGILILTCLYVFISAVIYAFIYGRPYDYLLPFVLIFSGGIFWVGQKINRPYVNLASFFFATGFSGLFWARNFILNSKTDTLLQFYIIGILFYLLFHAITIFASQSKEHPLRKWMQMVLGWSNMVFFVGTTSFVIIKYYSFGYLWAFVLAVLLFNVAVIYLLKRYKGNAWELPHYFTAMFLASLVLPLILHQNMPLLFMAVLSVLMLLYALEFKITAAFWISCIATAAMLVFYLFYWVFSYLPAMLPGPVPPDAALLLHGVLSGIAVVTALWIAKRCIHVAEFPLSKWWFSRTAYSRLIRTILLNALFFTMGWIGFALAIRLTGTLLYASAGWFIAGSLFFIGMISHYAGKQSIFKKTVQYLAFAFALLYPLMVQWSMAVYTQDLLKSGDFTLLPLLLHYVALASLVILGLITVRRIYRRSVKNLFINRTVQVLTIVFLLFVLCAEYDNVSMLLAALGNNTNSGTASGEQILASNHMLPWSILMWALTVVVFIRAIVTKNLFQRNFSIVLYLLILVKVFAWDFSSLSQGGKSAVFIVLGLFLIGFAVVYPRLQKAYGKVAVPQRKGREGGVVEVEREKEKA
jgi:hypothetical protein